MTTHIAALRASPLAATPIMPSARRLSTPESMVGCPKVLASVGACQRSECSHNEHLMCGAAAVRVGPGADNADCLTYEHTCSLGSACSGANCGMGPAGLAVWAIGRHRPVPVGRSGCRIDLAVCPVARIHCRAGRPNWRVVAGPQPVILASDVAPGRRTGLRVAEAWSGLLGTVLDLRVRRAIQWMKMRAMPCGRTHIALIVEQPLAMIVQQPVMYLSSLPTL